jgi:hypothetical protein
MPLNTVREYCYACSPCSHTTNESEVDAILERTQRDEDACQSTLPIRSKSVVVFFRHGRNLFAHSDEEDLENDVRKNVERTEIECADLVSISWRTAGSRG